MKKISYIVGVCVGLLISCSKDDGTPNKALVGALDFSLQIEEHPTDGTSLGRIEGNNLENAVFKIVDQNPPNAFSVDSQTGELTINDSRLFDYEINPNLTANLTVNNEVSSDELKVEITLVDTDEIALFLSNSKEAYNSAENGDWILITEEEYEALADLLIEVTRIGTTEEEYGAEGQTVDAREDFTFAMSNASIPEGAFVFAFKYDNASSLSSKAKLKFSANIWSGYTDFGPVLPSHGIGESYFLLKGNAQSFESSGYLGFYNENSIRWTRTQGQSSRFYFGFGDNSTMEQYYENFIVRYQGLCTTIKQWD